MPPHPVHDLGAIERAKQAFLDARQLAAEVPSRVSAARTQLIDAVTCHGELGMVEKAGWLIAIDTADAETDMAESAESTIDTLGAIDSILKNPGVPIVVYAGRTINRGQTCNVFISSGQGLLVDVVDDKPVFSLGASRAAEPKPEKDSVDYRLLLGAVTDPEAIEEMDVSRQVYTFDQAIASKSDTDVLIVGEEAIAAFVEKLMKLDGSELQARQAQQLVFEIWKMAKHLGVKLEDKSQSVASWLKAERQKVAREMGKSTVNKILKGETVNTIKVKGSAEELGIDPDTIGEAAHFYSLDLSRRLSEQVRHLRRNHELD